MQRHLSIIKTLHTHTWIHDVYICKSFALVPLS